MKKSYAVDMVNGPLLSRILIYAFPLILSGVLQLLFNAADIVVVGKFTGSHALAAVGSTSALINLLVNLFIGISIGTNVMVARYCGARTAELRGHCPHLNRHFHHRRHSDDLCRHSVRPSVIRTDGYAG